MIAKNENTRGDYELGQRRMRIEEGLAVQIMASLRDEMDLIENDLGGMPQMPEARDRGDDQQRRDDDRIGRDPRGRGGRFFNVILDLPGHGESPEERSDGGACTASALQPRCAVVNGQRKRGHVEHRGRHRKRIARVQKHHGVKRVQDVGQIDQAGDRDNYEDCKHLGCFQSQRHRKYDRGVEVPLVHPGRNHEESKNRDERGENEARGRAAAPQDPRNESVERHQQAHPERKVRYSANSLRIRLAKSADQRHQVECVD